MHLNLVARLSTHLFLEPLDEDVPVLGQPGKQKQHEALYWEFHTGRSKQAVRMGHWKAIRFGAGGKLELYDLRTDLGETTNVADHHPDVVAKIETYLTTARTPSKFWSLKD